MRELAGIVALVAGFWPAAAQGGFRTPESVVRNVYAHYGQGAPELSKGLPQDGATARQFFAPSLRKVWSAPRVEPYDFLVQSPSWKLGPVAIAVIRRHRQDLCRGEFRQPRPAGDSELHPGQRARGLVDHGCREPAR
ncbi:hypothetical protein ACVWZ6_006352 [Bradyrhizobium sp. GM6.1]